MLIHPDVFASIVLVPGGTVTIPIKKSRDMTLIGIAKLFMVCADPFSVRRFANRDSPECLELLYLKAVNSAAPLAKGTVA